MPPVRRSAIAVLIAVQIAATVVACGSEEATSAPTAATASAPSPDRFDERRAFRDLKRQVEFGPRPRGSEANRRLTRWIARRLREAGASGVRIQRPHRNVVATIKGGPRTVVIGAHHDTKKGVPNFVGANDGASGVAVVLELARHFAKRPRLRHPTIAVALFDAEEARGDRDFYTDGLRGSTQYVSYSTAGREGIPAIDEIDAMVLFDLVGDCDLAIPRESNSSAELYGVVEDAAEDVASRGGPDSPFGGQTTAIGDDHVPFIEAGIEAVDLIDFDYGPGPSPGAWWHTAEDTIDKVCASSLDAVGEAAALAIPRL